MRSDKISFERSDTAAGLGLAMHVHIARTGQPSMLSQSGITGTMQFPSKKMRALPKTMLDCSGRELEDTLHSLDCLDCPKRLRWYVDV